MKKRENPLGDSNIVGENIRQIRLRKGMTQKELLIRLQVYGLDINPSSLSKAEGQTRKVTDRELLAFSEVLEVSCDDLLKK